MMHERQPWLELEISYKSTHSLERFFFFSSRRRHTRFDCDWSSDVCSSDLSEAATSKPFARFWVHGEFLNVRGTKMSKRFGNFLAARDLRDQGVDAAAVRLLFWQTHYRKALDFTDDALAAAGAGVKRLGEFSERIGRDTGNPKGLPDGRGKGDGRLAGLGAKVGTEFPF